MHTSCSTNVTNYPPPNMKGYESYLTQSIRVEWSPNYIDYTSLKDKLKSFYDRRKQLREFHVLTVEDFSLLIRDSCAAVGEEVVAVPEIAGCYDNVGCNADAANYFQFGDDDSDANLILMDRKDAVRRLSVLERKEFSQLLEQHISKAARFYTETLLVNLNNLTVENKDVEKASMELLETLAFCSTNIITFRQLIIRYDAFRRTFDGMPLTEWVLQQSKLGPSHPVHLLFTLDGLEKLETLIMKQMHEMNIDSNSFSIQYETFLHLLDETNGSIEQTVAGHLVWRDRVLTTMRKCFLLGFQSRGLVGEPELFTKMRGVHLKMEMKAIAKWRETHEFSSKYVKGKEEDSLAAKLKTMEPENVFPLFLNLLSCFLFMMNNYIIEPSSAYYAEALGSSDALSGMMMGAAPWFAMISSVGYSYWTNSNYKYPIVFAGVLQFIGNLMYANAYSHRSIQLCLIGRAITGLGAPRVINRRYVADATPFSIRTAASAAFGLATALGAALGPGMAIVLDHFEFEFYLPFLGTQYFNGMTGPGYFMALNWLLYTIAIVVSFNEPIRSGLDELKEREVSGDVAGSKKSPLIENKDSTLDEMDIGGITSVDKTPKEINRVSVGESVDDFTDDLSVDESLPGYDGDYSDSAAIGNSSKYCCSCVGQLTKPVVICMFLIFVQRVALESIVGATSVVTKNRYGWSIKNVGTLHLVNGLIVIPVTILSGYLSNFREDRYLSLCFLTITLGGMAILFDPTDLANQDNYTYNSDNWLSTNSFDYIAGCLISFSGIEANETFVSSLMSKVVPSSLATGTFNAGLLATLVGTGGRATGDLFITLMGLESLRGLLNLLIIPGASLVSCSICMILWNYEILGI